MREAIAARVFPAELPTQSFGIDLQHQQVPLAGEVAAPGGRELVRCRAVDEALGDKRVGLVGTREPGVVPLLPGCDVEDRLGDSDHPGNVELGQPAGVDAQLGEHLLVVLAEPGRVEAPPALR